MHVNSKNLTKYLTKQQGCISLKLADGNSGALKYLGLGICIEDEYISTSLGKPRFWLQGEETYLYKETINLQHRLITMLHVSFSAAEQKPPELGDRYWLHRQALAQYEAACFLATSCEPACLI